MFLNWIQWLTVKVVSGHVTLHDIITTTERPIQTCFVIGSHRHCVWCSLHTQSHGGGAAAGSGQTSTWTHTGLPCHSGAAAMVRRTADQERRGKSWILIEFHEEYWTSREIHGVLTAPLISVCRRKHHDGKSHLRPESCFHGSRLSTHSHGQRYGSWLIWQSFLVASWQTFRYLCLIWSH